MKTAGKISVMLAAGLMAASPLVAAFPALADTATAPAATTAPAPAVAPAATPAPSKAQDKAFIKTSDAAWAGLRATQNARVAIFNGDVKQAETLTQQALADMTKAETDDKGLAVQTSKSKSGDQYLPVDVQVNLADGFIATPEKAAKIAEANQHMAKGETKQAVDVLKLANVDVVVSAALIPSQASVADLQHAQDLLNQGKYYEANLALKAVADGVIVDSYGLDQLPVQS